MGHILHDWDLPTKKVLIGKAFEAIPAGGALIVYESIIDDDRSKNAFGLMMSLNMLIETPGGFDTADCTADARGFSPLGSSRSSGPTDGDWRQVASRVLPRSTAARRIQRRDDRPSRQCSWRPARLGRPHRPHLIVLLGAGRRL
jgi:hypothetical protein